MDIYDEKRNLISARRGELKEVIVECSMKEDKYESLFLYLNANISYREETGEKYIKAIKDLKGDFLLDELVNFHLVRERFVDLRNEVSFLEADIRKKVGERLKNAN